MIRVHYKTCARCGRTGSHAFRLMADGRHECTTQAACRARMRRNHARQSQGRGRLPGDGAGHAAGSRVTFLIGQEGAPRSAIEQELRRGSGSHLVIAPPTRSTLGRLALRNVRMIAIDGSCLAGVGFRNEFALRCRQPRLASVPILVYGDQLNPSLVDSLALPGLAPFRSGAAEGEQPSEADG